MAELTPQQVDYLLFNRAFLRRLLSFTEPNTSSSVVKQPTRKTRPASLVERVALLRATLSQGLDELDEAVRTLPPELKQVASWKYLHHMTYREMAARQTKRLRRRGITETRVSTSTVHCQVQKIREHCASRCPSVNKEFWSVLRTLLNADDSIRD
jgi:hypothetical protein